MHNLPLLLIALLAAHFYLDYAGQGDFMAKAKNPSTPVPGVPWRQVLFAHAFLHGAAVALITEVWWLVMLETVVHYVTDWAKCRNFIDYSGDQFIHIVSKIAWCGLAAAYA